MGKAEGARSLEPAAVLFPGVVAFAGAVHGVCRLLVGFEGAPQGGDGALLAAFNLAGFEVVPVLFGVRAGGFGRGVQGLFDRRFDGFAQAVFLLTPGFSFDGEGLVFLASHARRFVAMRRAELLTAFLLHGLPLLPSTPAFCPHSFASSVHEILFTIWEKGTACVSAAF